MRTESENFPRNYKVCIKLHTKYSYQEKCVVVVTSTIALAVNDVEYHTLFKVKTEIH